MELVEDPYVSGFTRKTLEQFGWKQGDPIPVEFGTALMKMKESAPASARTDVLLDAAVLTEAQVKQITDMLAAAKHVAANRDKQAQIENATANMAPSVAAMYAQMVANEGPTIVDDTATAPDPAPAPDPVPPPTEPPATPVEESLPIVLPFCPRCGWDMRNKFEVAVTDSDKYDFMASLLGGTRFYRSFEIMGGKMKFKFRSMLAEENKMVHRQLVLDQNEKDAANVVVTAEEWFLRLTEYRLACSLESITKSDGTEIQIVPEVKNFPFKPPENAPLQTPLVALLEFVNTTVLPGEIIRRLARQHLREFQRLMEALEAMALEPSFWDGIG